MKDSVVWADDRIKPGQMWRDRISMAIEQADIAILLLSADFFASDFITENELPSLLTKKDAGRMTILTLAISSFGEIKGSYAKQVQAIQGINSADRPLLKMRVAEREETYKAAALRVAELLGIDDSGDTGEARESGG